jgi:hypothetical protein
MVVSKHFVLEERGRWRFSWWPRPLACAVVSRDGRWISSACVCVLMLDVRCSMFDVSAGFFSPNLHASWGRGIFCTKAWGADGDEVLHRGYELYPAVSSPVSCTVETMRSLGGEGRGEERRYGWLNCPSRSQWEISGLHRRLH